MSGSSEQGNVGRERSGESLPISTRIRGHLRSNVVAYIALFFALGFGQAWASQLAKNSVGSKQIRNQQVKARDLAKKSVRAKHVKPGQLQLSHFDPAAQDALTQPGAAGPPGADGEDGAAGPAGPQGAAGAQGEPGQVAAGSVGSAEIADGSITSADIADGTITPFDLAPVSTGINVPAAAFVQADPSDDDRLGQSAASGYLFTSPASTGPSYEFDAVAPVMLPAGVRLDQLACRRYDARAGDDLSGNVSLYSRAATASSRQDQAEVTVNTGGVSGAVVESSDSTFFVSRVQANADYWLALSFDSNSYAGSAIRFYGCTIRYTVAP